MSFGRDLITDADRGNLITHCCDLTKELMSENQRRIDPIRCEFIPIVDVEIRPTDSGRLYLNKDLIAANLWGFDLFKFSPWPFLCLNKRSHLLCHLYPR